MMDLFKTAFRGFEPADFACYTRDKWSSRLHNRARMNVQGKLTALGRGLQEALSDKLQALVFETNDPIPSVFNSHAVDAQWLFLIRDQENRRALSTIIDREHTLADNLKDSALSKRHLILAAKLHEGGLDVMLGLHRHAWVDVQNVLRKLSFEQEGRRLARLLGELPAELAEHLHVVGPLGVEPLATVEAGRLLEHVRAFSDEHDWLILGRNFAADAPELQDAALVGQVAAHFEALLPLYRLLAWSKENDWLSLQLSLHEQKEQAKRGELEAGDEVKVTSGLFQGRTGVVQSVDKEGMAKVQLGKMVVQIKVQALQPLHAA
jgi:transcription antitermination factor NusG